MADEGKGNGPGKDHATLAAATTTAGVLVAAAAVLLLVLVTKWPECDLPAETPPQAGPLRVTSILPGSGSTAGGQEVTILGAGFTGDATVSFAKVPATISVRTPGLLKVLAPKHDVEERVTVTVSTKGGAADLAGGFVYRAEGPAPTPPRIDSVSPKAGPHGGGQRVTISGAGFDSVGSVTFGGVPAADVVVVSDATLMALTPAHADGHVDVVVSGSSSATLSDAYTFSCWAGQRSRFFLLVVVAGALGGTLHALRSLAWYVGQRDLRRSWLLTYYLLPVTGALIGTIFYLVFLAGFFTVQGSATYALIGVGGLVGMFSTQAAEKLKKIAEGLLTEAPQGNNSSKPVEKQSQVSVKVEQVVPAEGPLGVAQSVEIQGSGFAVLQAAGVQVTFGGVPAPSVEIVNDQTIRATTPPGSNVGPVDVVVGSATLPAAATKAAGYRYK
jgi:hypothetical protein